MADRTVTVAGVKMALPAFITALTGIMAGFLLAFKGEVQLGLSIMVTLLIQSYTINCEIVGHCNMWAWFMAIGAIVSILGFFHLIRKGGPKFLKM